MDTEKLDPKQRGPKGYFRGSRKTFLESQLTAYMAVKKGGCQILWHALWSAWWERFPWKLSDDDEPPTGDPDEMARLVSVELGEEDRKKAVEERLTEVRCDLHFSIGLH